MANEENLKPVRTKSEARERGKKGGVASGATRRKKKAMKERLFEALDRELTNPAAKNLTHSVNMDGETNYDALVASMLVGALEGNPAYAKLIVELMGETGYEKRAAKQDRRDAKRLKMQQEEFEYKKRIASGEGVAEDNDRVLKFIEGMKGDNT